MDVDSRTMYALLVALSIVVYLSLSLTSADARLYSEGALPLPPAAMVVTFSILFIVVVYLDCRSRQDFRRVWRLGRDHLHVIAPFIVLALLSLFWSQMPMAYWSAGWLTPLYPGYELFNLLIAMLLPFLRVFRKQWQFYLRIPLVLCIAAIFIEVFAPTSLFGEPGRRPTGFAFDPNYAAFYLSMLCASTVRYGALRSLDLVAIAATGSGVFLTLSRSGAICFVVFLAFYVAHLIIRLRTFSVRTIRPASFFGVAACLVVLALATIYGSTHLLSKAASSGGGSRVKMLTGEAPIAVDNSADSRLALALEAIDLIRQAPILGHGTGATAYNTMRPHNTYLLLWAEFGILGIVSYVWILAGGFAAFYQRKFVAGQALIALVAVNGFFIHQHFEMRPIWVLVGILLSVSWFQGEHSWEAGARRLHVRSRGEPGRHRGEGRRKRRRAATAVKETSRPRLSSRRDAGSPSGLS